MYFIFNFLFSIIHYQLSVKPGGLAQLARASALHAEGHRFDSDILHEAPALKGVKAKQSQFLPQP